MPLTGEAKAEWKRKYDIRKREERENLEKVKQLDLLGGRYKSEVLPYIKLYEIYYGIKEAKEDEDKKKPTIKIIGEKILGQDHTFESWLEMRDRARKDLFWLGKEIFRKDLTIRTHKIVCDQFVQKNFDGVYHDGYTIGDVHRAIEKQVRFDEQGNPTKEMMLLDARGFFKSTLNQIDCAQWMLNVPDIRILILTGEYKLAVAFMSVIKGYFYLSEGSIPTDCHRLFPEYILTGVAGTSNEPIECPARQHNQKEPTVWVNSIMANLSGWHCDIKKGDDVVTDENSNTEEQREKLKEKYDGTGNLLDEWGFADHIGTRYFVDDWYGTRLKTADDDEYVPVKYFCRPCWLVKPDFVSLPLKKLTEAMVELTFPEKATFLSLRRKLLLNERQFRNQQLNEPSEDDDSPYKVTFNEDDLRKHVLPVVTAQKDGDIFICWDWAASSNKYSDFSCGIAGRVTKKDNKALLIIQEVIYGRWKPSELALQIVAFNKKWNPKTTLIEKSPGAELLQMEVQRQANRYSTVLNVYWKTPSNQPDAKRNRIKGVETLLNNDQLWFVAGLWLDDVFTQMCRYTGERKTRGRKDDIPDALSFFSFFLPSTENSEDMKKMQEEQKRQEKLRMNYQRLFGTLPGTITPPSVSATPNRSAEPRNIIFGNNGMHI